MKKTFLFLTAATLLALMVFVVAAWVILLKPNVSKETKGKIFIPTGSGFDAVLDTLESNHILKNKATFLLVSKLKHYDKYVKPGCYVLNPGTGNNSIVNTLMRGRQTPVRVTFNNVRTISDLAAKVGGQIEADSAQILTFLQDQRNYAEDGYTFATVISVFIPDTYEFYWTTTAEGFYRRMLNEFNLFWTKERVEKAKELNLTPVDVSILASIIDDEVAKNEEKPRIAGVYLNRLRIGMPLQACPTIKFALNDFTIRRVLDEYLTVESPYNTYKYRGLPPGPVRCPTKSGIDAVLNAEKHDYLFFAAKSDFSGYHHFSRTLAEHTRYANEYHRELNKRKIYN
jgi:UPF0755 protein